jgi:hypothetical protein
VELQRRAHSGLLSAAWSLEHFDFTFQPILAGQHMQRLGTLGFPEARVSLEHCHELSGVCQCGDHVRKVSLEHCHELSGGRDGVVKAVLERGPHTGQFGTLLARHKNAILQQLPLGIARQQRGKLGALNRM